LVGAGRILQDAAVNGGWTMRDVTIRAERPDDRDAIAHVVGAAFGSVVHPRLVDELRASVDFVPRWSLVAELDGAVVGHVMVTFAKLQDGAAARRIANLSPLAVAPELQGRGIGAALVGAVTAVVDVDGEPLVVLEGSPVYYSRLGFEPAAPYGIHIDLPDWAPAEAAQLMRLTNYDPAIRGTVVYPPAFAAAES
jgi:putative acetyltransferase